MIALLVSCAVLYGLGLLQALVGILLFRPREALSLFFLQSLCLFAAAFLGAAFEFRLHLAAAWALVGGFGLFFVYGFTRWKRPGPSAAAGDGTA